jgi:hypothetical protein
LIVLTGGRILGGVQVFALSDPSLHLVLGYCPGWLCYRPVENQLKTEILDLLFRRALSDSLVNTLARVAVFFIASAAIIQLSWRSLRDLRSHDFYRFFAFELLLALILLNVPGWFRDPLSARQLVSWFLGAASIGLAIEGFRWQRSSACGRSWRPAAGLGLAFPRPCRAREEKKAKMRNEEGSDRRRQTTYHGPRTRPECRSRISTFEIRVSRAESAIGSEKQALGAVKGDNGPWTPQGLLREDT